MPFRPFPPPPPDPVPALRLQLVREINAVLGLTNQFVAARRLGIDQPRMSDLQHERIARFSVERLVRFLSIIDRRVEIRVIADPGDRSGFGD